MAILRDRPRSYLRPVTPPVFRATEHFGVDQVRALYNALTAGMPPTMVGPGRYARRQPSKAMFKRLLEWAGRVEDNQTWVWMATEGLANVWERPGAPGEFCFEEVPGSQT
jgi:hypothetical protein